MLLCRHKARHTPHPNNRKEVQQMNMSEATRIILGLRAAGWDEKDINDFILWVETGDEQYKPKNAETNA